MSPPNCFQFVSEKSSESVSSEVEECEVVISEFNLMEEQFHGKKRAARLAINREGQPTDPGDVIITDRKGDVVELKTRKDADKQEHEFITGSEARVTCRRNYQNGTVARMIAQKKKTADEMVVVMKDADRDAVVTYTTNQDFLKKVAPDPNNDSVESTSQNVAVTPLPNVLTSPVPSCQALARDSPGKPYNSGGIRRPTARSMKNASEQQNICRICDLICYDKEKGKRTGDDYDLDSPWMG